MVTSLINFAHMLGYEVVIDYTKRCEDCPVGHANSLHKKKLAIDIDLFIDGALLRDTSQYTELGEFWTAIGGSWGGDFGDGRHFSLEHQGMR